MISFPYTDRNHFQYGYRDRKSLQTRWLEPRRRDDDEFVARYGRASTEFRSWREANRAAADRILTLAFEKQLVPVLLCGGGIDSEIVLVAFLEALEKRAPKERPRVQVASYVLSENGNQHDLEYIEKFRAHPKFSGKLRELSIEFKNHGIDAGTYLESPEFLTLADETKIVSPVVICQLHLCEKIFAETPNALPIIGQGEIHLVRDDDPSGNYSPRTWSIVETENLCGLYRFFIGREWPAIPGFFQYLPEQFDTQLRQNPVLHELISHSRVGKLGTRTSKPEILAHDYPELEPRPKYTGFEKLPELHDRWRASLGARFASSEAKWKRSVYDLARDVRYAPSKTATAGDWLFAWKQEGEDSRSIRGSTDDLFATDWARPESMEAVSVRAALLDFLAQQPNSALLHDGSLIARVINLLRPAKTNLPPELDEESKSKLPSQIARLAIQHQLYDAESLAWLIWNELLGQQTLIPLLHSRIVNAEFDRDLSATLAKPRFVALESERLALLTNALPENTRPLWSSRSLLDSVIGATAKSGWPSLEEPGISNHEPWLKFLETLLMELGESPSQKEMGQNAARAFQKLGAEIESAIKLCALPSARYLQSSRRVFENVPKQAASEIVLPHFAEAFSHSPNLRIVSTARWLEEAQNRVPDLTYGGNLFYQQKLEGFSKFNEDLRVSLALIHEGEEVAWAHVTALTLPPHGRLRIRGVTVRSDLDRRGFATQLIKEIATTLRTHRPIGYGSIDVYAAPEALKAFRAAGFRDDVSRVTRAEEALDPETGKLIALDRELTPLTFSLGEA